jgi:hypothetical protein
VRPYDANWLKEENDKRRAKGLPPLRQRKRSAVERERLRLLRQFVSHVDNPDYQLLSTRRPNHERAGLALAALFPSGVPDQAVLPNKSLGARVNEWLKAKGLPVVSQRTIQRAAGRK